MIKLTDILNEIEGQKYTIYCDMDGVLVDFDKGYKDLTRMSTEKANTQGKMFFWNVFKKRLREKEIPEKEFWANLSSTKPDKEMLWGYIEKYNPNILSSPSIDFKLPKDQQLDPNFNQSIQGKKEWIAKNISGVNQEIFVPASQKQQFSGENQILIDDRVDNIEQWKSKGGIGILHTSSSDTIKQLKELGL